MDRAKKKFASAIDGLRSFHNKMDINVDEKVSAEHCTLTKVVRHGLPDDARCIAYDPVQRLLAIGTGHGQVRIIGDAGVDYLLKHESEQAVLHMQFLVNEGGLITACANDMIHLWNYRQKVAEVVHSLQLSKEAVTCIHLPIAGKWLYVGTDKGNVYFVSVATFQLSPYVINWNKAIDLSCRVHPGPVRQLSGCPTDPLKILITYEKGILAQWNLANKEVDRFPLDPPIKCTSWHFDGRQILSGNVDGSISVLNIKKTSEIAQRSQPHGGGPCRPVQQIDWKHATENDQIIIFAGGMPTDDGLPVPAITILRGGRSATVIEMDHPIISFITLTQLAYNSCPQQPHSVAVLLKNDFMVLDLHQQGHPMIESPHAMNIHESPVTCTSYYSDCPLDLIGALTLVGTKQRKKDYSTRTWPVTGGIGRECATGHQELVITGHKDGTVRFWQESGEHLQILYRLKSASHFERLDEMETCEKVSHAVKSIELCVESRQLLVAGQSGQVTLFRFAKSENMNTIAVVHIPHLGNASTSWAADEKATTGGGPVSKEIRRQRKVMSRESTNSLDTSDSGEERIVPFKVRGAPVKRPPGYQPELACLVPWISYNKVDQLATIALNSAYGVIALGTCNGLALVDIAQCALIYAWTSSELYGSEPTPAIQLSMQLSDATSPLESPDEELLYNPATGVYSLSSSPRTSPIPPINVVTTSTTLAATSSTSVSNGLLAAGDGTLNRAKSPVSPNKSSGMMGIIRRNTAELAASIREKYQNSATYTTCSVDRPDVDCESPPPGEREMKTSRSHSVKGSIMRRFGKGNSSLKEKATVSVQRSRSFHSHISEEGKFLSHRSPGSSSQDSSSKASLTRLNTDTKQRSFDARRPQLFKAQSVVENGSGSRGETPRESPSLSRNTASPSTSSPSLERTSSNNLAETVTSLKFMYSYSKRNESKQNPCLWIGTSAGTSLVLNLILPEDRISSTVVVAPSGTTVKLKGQVLYQTFMDNNFCLLMPAAESYKETNNKESKDGASPEKSLTNRVATKGSLAPQYATPADQNDDIAQILIVAAEMEVKVIALPTFSQLFVHKCEDIPLVKVHATHVRGFPVLMCLNAAGQVVVLSLPSLRVLHSNPLIPHSIDIDDAICQKTSFSDHGLGVYMASNSEMEKFTISSELAEQTDESLGELFVPCEMPEAPKVNSFLKGVSSIFSGTPRQDSVDIDTILAENKEKSQMNSGGMRSIARTIPGPSMSMDRAHAGGVSAGQAAAQALQNLNERTEKLNATVDATENLKNNAMNLSSRTSRLVEKYEKKKWYQL